jgi:hypothetical protein
LEKFRPFIKYFKIIYLSISKYFSLLPFAHAVHTPHGAAVAVHAWVRVVLPLLCPIQTAVIIRRKVYKMPVFQIRDPVLFLSLDPGAGSGILDGKKSRSGLNTPDLIFEYQFLEL